MKDRVIITSKNIKILQDKWRDKLANNVTINHPIVEFARDVWSLYNSSDIEESDVYARLASVDFELLYRMAYQININDIVRIDLRGDIITTDCPIFIHTFYHSQREFMIKACIIFSNLRNINADSNNTFTVCDLKSNEISNVDAKRYITKNTHLYGSLLRNIQIIISDVSKHRDVDFFVNVGRHVSGGLKTVINNMKKYMMPTQIFLSSPRSSKVLLSAGVIDVRERYMREQLKYTDDMKRRVFVHGCYVINPCNRSHNISKHIDELSMCSRFGFSGLVVHVGKNVQHENPKVALETMKLTLSRIIITSRQKTNGNYHAPLILETSAGQGTETLTSFNEMLNFCREMLASFPDEFGVCIDTCHVFALGYSPLYYLMRMYSELGSAVKLVHLNDSGRKLGSRVDLHREIGQGYINKDELAAIASFCTYHNIAAITEPS